MKLKKLAAGVLAAVVAVTSAVVTPIIVTAEDTVEPLWSESTSLYIDNSMLEISDLSAVTEVVANVTYTNCGEWSNGGVYVNCDGASTTYFGTGTQTVGGMTADTATDVSVNVTVSNWMQVTVSEYGGGTLVVNSITFKDANGTVLDTYIPEASEKTLNAFTYTFGNSDFEFFGNDMSDIAKAVVNLEYSSVNGQWSNGQVYMYADTNANSVSFGVGDQTYGSMVADTPVDVEISGATVTNWFQIGFQEYGGGAVVINSITLYDANDNIITALPVTYATDITLSETTLELKKGDNNALLTATVGPEDATDKTVTWSSSDSDVVSVNTDGTLTALNNGTATITATANGADPDGDPVSASCEITVTNPAQYISLDKTSLELKTGETYTFTVTPTPEDADEYELEWTIIENTPSHDEGVDVISIDENGKVTALNRGSAAVRAAVKGNENVSIECMIIVTSPVTGITFEQETMELIKGDVAGIAFHVAPESANNKKITWSSDDTSVATVDESGNVTATGSGTATITATTEDGGFTATCKVTVTNPIQMIDLTQRSLGIVEGETAELTVITTPTDCDPFEITWSTDDESVATVDENGVITAVAEGSCVIRATVTDEIFIECVVTVTADVVAADGVSLNETEYTLDAVGDTVALVASVTPSDATNQDVTWTSSDPDVATVDEFGIVTAVANGTAVITVTTKDGDYTATCNITVDIAVEETPEAPEETPEAPDVPVAPEAPETEDALDEGTYGDGEYAQLPESEIPEMIYGPVDISDQFISTKAETSATYTDGKLYIYSQYEESDLAQHDSAYIVVKHNNGKALKITTGCAYTRLMEGVEAADNCLYLAFVISNVSNDANDPLYFGNFEWTDIVME
ncbi:MAG: Ig-like domain-containing protein [Oscillospiraceae bacterium]|nr:Ig-like domain-containing protein [Oscillospiraceae bacterium]